MHRSSKLFNWVAKIWNSTNSIIIADLAYWTIIAEEQSGTQTGSSQLQVNSNSRTRFGSTCAARSMRAHCAIMRLFLFVTNLSDCRRAGTLALYLVKAFLKVFSSLAMSDSMSSNLNRSAVLFLAICCNPCNHRVVSDAPQQSGRSVKRPNKRPPFRVGLETYGQLQVSNVALGRLESTEVDWCTFLYREQVTVSSLAKSDRLRSSACWKIGEHVGF